MAITCICIIVVAAGPKKGFSCLAGRLRIFRMIKLRYTGYSWRPQKTVERRPTKDNNRRQNDKRRQKTFNNYNFRSPDISLSAEVYILLTNLLKPFIITTLFNVIRRLLGFCTDPWRGRTDEVAKSVTHHARLLAARCVRCARDVVFRDIASYSAQTLMQTDTFVGYVLSGVPVVESRKNSAGVLRV